MPDAHDPAARWACPRKGRVPLSALCPERPQAAARVRVALPLAWGTRCRAVITMRQEDRGTLMGVEEGVAAFPHVLQAQGLFGDPDYLLRIVATGLAACRRLQDETLCTPGIQRMTSTLVRKRIVNDRPLPA